MTDFHEGTNHNHRPSGRWAEVQANPNSPGASSWLIRACKGPCRRGGLGGGTLGVCEGSLRLPERL
jgi:hypothetical protein